MCLVHCFLRFLGTELVFFTPSDWLGTNKWIVSRWVKKDGLESEGEEEEECFYSKKKLRSKNK